MKNISYKPDVCVKIARFYLAKEAKILKEARHLKNKKLKGRQMSRRDQIP